MSLSFPTLAEQCHHEFKTCPGTVAIPTIAKRMGAQVYKNYPITEYCFDDDSSLTVQGVGKAHKVETFLP